VTWNSGACNGGPSPQEENRTAEDELWWPTPRHLDELAAEADADRDPEQPTTTMRPTRRRRPSYWIPPRVAGVAEVVELPQEDHP
jgi:hypothetical protein